MIETLTKTLEVSFTSDNNVYTQLKRTDKTALYKRETLEGTLVSHEVFAILKDSDGNEVYPTKIAAGKWLWSPISLAKAETFFNRIETGETVILPFNPLTGEIIRDFASEPSLEEVLAETNSTDVVVSLTETTETVDVSPVETLVEAPVDVPTETTDVVESTLTVVTDLNTADSVVDPTEPPAPITPTVDVAPVVKTPKVKVPKVKAVVVKTPKAPVTYTIPTGEFTQAQFATVNGLPVRGAVWGILDKLVTSGKLNKVLRQVGRGRPTQFFTEIVSVSTV